LVLHVTLATATLSEAVPAKFSDVSVVETEVELGDVMVNIGAVVSPEGGVTDV
jgi:hypothetical protein